MLKVLLPFCMTVSQAFRTHHDELEGLNNQSTKRIGRLISFHYLNSKYLLYSLTSIF